MDFYKAISILGLKENFTEEEFKSAYRKLSHECHPDKYEGTPQYEIMKRKQQEINEAREFLKKYSLKTPSKNEVTIQDYIKYKKEKLTKIITDDGPKILDKDYETTLNAIKKIINKFEIDICNTYIVTKTDVDEAYEECIKSIKTRYSYLKGFFYKKNNITKEDVKESINYDCTLKEFYEQLQKIEKKYGQKAKIEKRLEQEIQKYQYFIGYEKLSNLIHVSLKTCLIELEKNNFQNMESIIDKMHQEILNVFAVYHTQQQEIKNLSQEVSATKNEIIQNTYEQLRKDFKEGLTFQEVEAKITYIKLLIKEHQSQLEKISNFNKNKQEINNIYLNLIKKHSEVIKKYNIVTEYETIMKLNEFLNRVLKIFIEGFGKYKDLEYFELFNQLTFTDIDSDLKTIQTIIKNLNQSNEEQEGYNNKHHKK